MARFRFAISSEMIALLALAAMVGVSASPTFPAVPGPVDTAAVQAPIVGDEQPQQAADLVIPQEAAAKDTIFAAEEAPGAGLAAVASEGDGEVLGGSESRYGRYRGYGGWGGRGYGGGWGGYGGWGGRGYGGGWGGRGYGGGWGGYGGGWGGYGYGGGWGGYRRGWGGWGGYY